MKNLLTTIIATTTLIASVARSEAAAVDYFVEVDGIPGESTVAGHSGQIHLESFSLQAFQRNLVQPGGSTASPALAMCRPVTLIIPTDQSWPLLFKACMTGQHLKKVTLFADYFADSNGGPTGNFLTVTLEDVLVASVELNNNGDRSTGGSVGETVTLHFTSVGITYRPVLMNGNFGMPITTKFNLSSNKTAE